MEDNFEDCCQKVLDLGKFITQNLCLGSIIIVGY